MTPAVTVKGQVTIPKRIRDFLDIGPGSRIEFELLPDGRVAIRPVAQKRRRKATVSITKDDPLAKWVGAASGGVSTDVLMRMTRGEDWNQP
jgi:antitoxin PrlF